MTANDLWSYPFFSGLTDAQLNLLAPATRLVSVPKHELLFTEGRHATHLYVIVRGRLALEMSLSHRPNTYPDPVTLSTLGPPQAVGFWALVKPYFYAYSARAVEKLDCLAVHGETLRNCMEANPQLGYAIMQKVAGQLAIRLDQASEVLAYQRKLIESPSYEGHPFREDVAHRSVG